MFAQVELTSRLTNSTTAHVIITIRQGICALVSMDFELCVRSHEEEFYDFDEDGCTLTKERRDEWIAFVHAKDPVDDNLEWTVEAVNDINGDWDIGIIDDKFIKAREETRSQSQKHLGFADGWVRDNPTQNVEYNNNSHTGGVLRAGTVVNIILSKDEGTVTFMIEDEVVKKSPVPAWPCYPAIALRKTGGKLRLGSSTPLCKAAR